MKFIIINLITFIINKLPSAEPNENNFNNCVSKLMKIIFMTRVELLYFHSLLIKFISKGEKDLIRDIFKNRINIEFTVQDINYIDNNYGEIAVIREVINIL